MAASCVRVPLNNELFFKYFACKAFTKASRELLNAKDLLKARIALIALGIFTLGIGICICRCYYYDRKTINPANLLKMQKKHIIKKFSGSDENKIKLINSFCETLVLESHFKLTKPSILRFKQQYDVLKSIETEDVAKLCMRNKERIKSFLLPYICAFEVMALRSDSENKYEEIEALEGALLRRGSMHAYRECLIDLFDNNLATAFTNSSRIQPAAPLPDRSSASSMNLAPSSSDEVGNKAAASVMEKILHSKSEERDAYFEAVYNACLSEDSRGLDFLKFKSIYSLVRAIVLKNDSPNHLLVKSHDSNLNKKIRILAFACEMLSWMESQSSFDPLFHIIDLAVEAVGPINYNEQESLRNFLQPTVSIAKINMIISFLIVEKGSPLHVHKKEEKEELVKIILRLGCVKRFVIEGPTTLQPQVINLEKLNGPLKIFRTVGDLQFKEQSQVDRLIQSLGGLRSKIGMFCDIELKGMAEKDKNDLFEHLSKEGADLDRITLNTPGWLQFTYKINKIGDRTIKY
jgi:hypothetical protein